MDMALYQLLAMPDMPAGGRRVIDLAVACESRGPCIIDIVGVFVRVPDRNTN